ncbi:MAG: hypothetical protein ACRCUJ_04590 [Phocaeicola sp.]
MNSHWPNQEKRNEHPAESLAKTQRKEEKKYHKEKKVLKKPFFLQSLFIKKEP